LRRLIVAPHMDDESLGCGGLMAKYADECTVVTVVDSGETRTLEHAEAMKILTVSDTRSLGLRDGHAGDDMPGLVGALDSLLSELRPDEIYLPYPSLHQDHIAVYEAGMRACRASMTEGHWVPRTVLVYDIAVYDINLYPTDLRWNVFEELTEEQAELKARACAAYVSEIPQGTHPMTSVKSIASSVGHVRLIDFAEQYALVRQVRR
jgi:LmbE family N-acetylglucosaminyl deacetylase